MSAYVIPLDPDISLGRVSGINSLPPFPAVACRLLQLVGDDDVNFHELTRWLITDSVLSAQVLRIANSPLFGFRKEIKSISQAVCLIGVNRVRDVVATVTLKNYVGRCDNHALHSCWRHGLAAALWCEALARSYRIDKSSAYTSGLLHDIGRIALLMLLPGDYPSFLEKDFSSDREMLNCERAQFNVNHCQVGLYLSRIWKLQPVLSDAIGHHHDEPAPGSPVDRTLAQAGCLAANMSGFAAAGSQRQWEPERISRMLQPAGNSMNGSLDALHDYVTCEINRVECQSFVGRGLFQSQQLRVIRVQPNITATYRLVAPWIRVSAQRASQ